MNQVSGLSRRRVSLFCIASACALLFASNVPAQEGLFSFFAPTKAKVANKLKQIALGMHNYHDVYRRFPPTGLEYSKKPDEKPREMLSWRVRLLPFLEQVDLYEQFDFNEPWDGPTNKPLLAKMPDIYRTAGLKLEDPTKTVFLAVTMDRDAQRFNKQLALGEVRHKVPTTVFDRILPIGRAPGFQSSRISGIIDGTVFSIMVVEADAKRAVPWTKPDDLEFQYAKPWDGLGELRKGGFNCAMADGAAVSIDKAKANDKTLLKAFLVNDGLDSSDVRNAKGPVR